MLNIIAFAFDHTSERPFKKPDVTVVCGSFCEIIVVPTGLGQGLRRTLDFVKMTAHKEAVIKRTWSQITS